MRYLRGLLLAVWIGALCALPVLAQAHTGHLPLILHGAKAPEPSATPSGTATITATHTRTPTATRTATITTTPSRTATATRTATPTRTGTFTRTPTATRTATATATRTRTATATRTPTGTAAPPVEILANHAAYQDVSGALWVMGEVKNNTRLTLRFVNVAVDFFDGEHSLVDTDSSNAKLDDLPPGERTCFIVANMSPAANWQTYAFRVTYFSDGAALPPEVTIPTHNGHMGPFNYEIVGQVHNGSNLRVRFVSVVGTVYDSTGRVASCDYAFVNSTHLDPGQTSSFKIYAPPYSHNPLTSYRVQVEGVAG